MHFYYSCLSGRCERGRKVSSIRYTVAHVRFRQSLRKEKRDEESPESIKITRILWIPIFHASAKRFADKRDKRTRLPKQFVYRQTILSPTKISSRVLHLAAIAYRKFIETKVHGA